MTWSDSVTKPGSSRRPKTFRRRKLEETFGQTESVRAEIGTLDRQVEESVKETKYVGPKMDPGMLNTLRSKRDAMVRRGKDHITADTLEDLRARKAVQSGPSKRLSDSTTQKGSGSELASSQPLRSEQDCTMEDTDLERAMAEAEDSFVDTGGQ